MSDQDLKRQLINPPQTQVLYDTYHFSQANRVGNIVWVSGQVGIDANFVPGADITEQSHLAFQALRNILEEAGGSLGDVVELVTFHTDLQGEVQAFGQVKDEHFPDRYPAWSAVGVTQLSLPQLRVEIRAVAVIGSGAA